MSQKQYKPHFDHLKNKWSDQQKSLQKTLFEKHKDAFDWLHHHAQQFAVGSLGSLVMLSSPGATSVAAQQLTPPAKPEPSPGESLGASMRVVIDMAYLLPEDVSPLSDEQEKVVGQSLSRHYGIPVTAELQGKRLNRSYGIIGAEQHLMRYPGDTMSTHFAQSADADKYYSSGMAPGRGAWGYFATSQAELTEKAEQQEKYYIAVQTFLAPGFDQNVKDRYEFFKYRKMLVVNPQNGRGMVVDIADAGPSPWTGKHLGGSPEVMSYLDRHDGAQRGGVLYFFVDDPNDTIPLGPIVAKN